MFSFIPNQLSLTLRSPRVLIAAGLGVAAAVGVTRYVLTRPKPSAEELERERRDALARSGRITDGSILDTLGDTLGDTPGDTLGDSMVAAAAGALMTEAELAGLGAPVEAVHPDPSGSHSSTPRMIIYNYRIGGVGYECAQDVAMLAEHVRGIRTDLPIQVRYEPHNPGNSIVVAESWSGLRLISANPLHPDAGSSRES